MRGGKVVGGWGGGEGGERCVDDAAPWMEARRRRYCATRRSLAHGRRFHSAIGWIGQRAIVRTASFEADIPWSS